ncbi:MAG: uroporphyrinogen decarboxylase family protein [Candidatus Omnitrophota bacterium]
MALQHKETDRIPIAMVCSGINEPARRHFDDYLKRERAIGIGKYLDDIVDIKGVAPDYVGPRLSVGQDIWGVERKPISYGLGIYDEIVHHPLADAKTVDDVRKHPWPTTNIFNYSVIPQQVAKIQKERERCLMISGANMFETSWYMRGFQQMFMDLAINPELAHVIMTQVTDFFVAHYRKILAEAEGMIDLAFTADDIGGQGGLLMSLDMWEQFIKPYHIRLNAVIHEFGVRVIYHTDGAIMEAIPGLIAMGIDVLQALQFDAKGMNPVEMKEKYGRELSFEGGVSVQKTLPFGSSNDVWKEVEHLISILGRSGGYIIGPAHAIQAGTPPENIFAMFETALRYYPFGK